MPELPEVETVRAGLAERLVGRRVVAFEARCAKLRWEVPVAQLEQGCVGRVVETVARRGKYLLWGCGGAGHVVMHLGMSGRVMILEEPCAWERHDHLEWGLEDGVRIRFRDPRRFGSVFWWEGGWEDHPLLAGLGVEPLAPGFDADWLYGVVRRRRGAIKGVLMNARVLVGVGNIYASEALFRAGIHPATPAGTLTHLQCETLVTAVVQVLRSAIAQGGTTWRDYRQSDGRLGYFALSLQVYQRAGQACHRCGGMIRSLRLGQRSAFYCPVCQPGCSD